MPNDYITNVKVDGTTYDIKDTVSGYTTNTGTVTGVTAGTGLSGGTISTSGTISLDTTRALTTSDITTGTDTDNKLVSAKTIADALSGFGGGTVTSVGITNGGGLTVSGSPVTTSGSITVGHSNSVTAQGTQGVYPITIDANGHIASYGSAVTIPSQELFIVNATITTVVSGVPTGGTTDKTSYEIYQAANNGLLPVVVIAFGSAKLVASLALTEYVSETDTAYARFVYEDQANAQFQYATLQVIGNSFTLSFLPPYLRTGGGIDGVGCSIADYDNSLTFSSNDIDNNTTIYIGHANNITAQSTEAIYPVTIDANGHIASYGTAVTLPTGTVTSVQVQATSPIVSSVNTAQSSTLNTTISHANSGVTAGTYNNVTVDAMGHVTSGSNISDTFKVTLSYNSLSDTYSVDKTFTEITAAVAANKYVYLYDATSSVVQDDAVVAPYSGSVQGDAAFTHLDGSTEYLYSVYFSDNQTKVEVYDNEIGSSDTKVTNTLDTTTKYYLTGTTSSTTNTGTQIFDTGIYSTTTAGQLNATTYKVNEQVTIQWNSTDSSLDFIF